MSYYQPQYPPVVPNEPLYKRKTPQFVAAVVGIVFGVLVALAALSDLYAGMILLSLAMLVPSAWWFLHERKEVTGRPMRRQWEIVVPVAVLLAIIGLLLPAPDTSASKSDNEAAVVSSPSESSSEETTPSTSRTTSPSETSTETETDSASETSPEHSRMRDFWDQLASSRLREPKPEDDTDSQADPQPAPQEPQVIQLAPQPAPVEQPAPAPIQEPAPAPVQEPAPVAEQPQPPEQIIYEEVPPPAPAPQPEYVYEEVPVEEIPIEQPAPQPQKISFKSCDEANANGYFNIRRGEPGYSSHLDADGDGIACDQNQR